MTIKLKFNIHVTLRQCSTKDHSLYIYTARGFPGKIFTAFPPHPPWEE